ncbi:hypothetical protein BG006_001746 [Podila minutissima]|uniref:C2H2-type domain-containing protein n=1 Tax=Podila minutissima TaxID=64525 RepID=A0A9P5VH22_9FUNG|nr:hypothetical protein BG006_001746 [Podila minutissima]
MDLPHQHRYQDPTSAKVFFDSCLDTFESYNNSNNTTTRTHPHPLRRSPSSASSSDTLVNSPDYSKPHRFSIDFTKNNRNKMDQHHSQHHQHHQHQYSHDNQQQQQRQQHIAMTAGHHDAESIASGSTAVDYAAPFNHLLAEALAREGFPGFASTLAFTQDQKQLEQVAVQSTLDNQGYPYEHQPQQAQLPSNLQDDSFLLDFMVQEHNMMVAQQQNYSAAPSSSSSSGVLSATASSHDANAYNVMNDMQPLEVFQYNSLILDGHLLDAVPFSVLQGGCGDGSNLDASAWCDSPLNLGVSGSGSYFQEQQFHPMHIPQHIPNGYYAPVSMPSSSSSSSSSSAASSSSSGSSSNNTHGYGLGFAGWNTANAGYLYPQGDYLLESCKRKREDGGMPSQQMMSSMPGAIYAPNARVQPHFEPAEADDSEDEDEGEEFGYDVEEQQINNNGYNPGYPGDDSQVPPLSSYSMHHHHNHSHHQRRASEELRHLSLMHSHVDEFQPAKKARIGSHPGHSRNSSLSSVHSHSDHRRQSSSSTTPPTSSSSSSSSTSKASRPLADTIEKRMHPCTFEGCSKSFTRAFNLRSHLNTHNGERPHKCPEEGCDWDFVRRHDLDRHVKSKHMANKPYACKQCSSRFGRSDALQRHRRLENHL